MQPQPTYPANGYFNPQIKSIAVAISEAKAIVDANRLPNRPVLPTRWKGVNEALLGGFRFDANYAIAGLSRHGKSYILNMLHQDFLASITLGTAPRPFRVLHFGYEQSAGKELLRRMSSELNMSYGDILSSKTRLSDATYSQLGSAMKKLKSLPIDFIEDPMSNTEMYGTISAYQRQYPDDRLVITMDHTLLATEDFGEDEIKMIANMGKMFIRIRKEFGSCAILLSQLNSNIESEKRRDPGYPGLHYPMMSDLHGSRQMGHAMDCILAIHQPALLDIEYYGRDNRPTKDLVAVHYLKVRDGEGGVTWLQNDLANGRFIDPGYIKTQKPMYGIT